MKLTYVNGGYMESFDTDDFPAKITEVVIDVTNPNGATWGFTAEYDCPPILVSNCEVKPKRKKKK